MIFTPDLAPSEEQFARIGRIHVTWANLEKALQFIMSRLALAPDWPAGALSDHLIFEHRLRSLDVLVEIHSRQIGYQLVPEPVCEKIKSMRKLLSQHREMRNRLAHWVIFRTGKDIAAARMATRTATEDRQDFVTYSTDDLNAHILAITAIMKQAEELLDVLPKQHGPFEDKRPGK